MARVAALLTKSCHASPRPTTCPHDICPLTHLPLPLYARYMLLGRPDASHFHLDRNVKRQSAKASLAGSVTGIARQCLVGLPPLALLGYPSVAAAPPCLPSGLSVALVCLTKPHHSVAGPTPNETNETHCRYRKCVFSYDECLIPALSRYGSAHGVVHSGTKVGHQVSPHRPPFIPMRGPSGPRSIPQMANAN